jgi:GcrA cell cycle regulator
MTHKLTTASAEWFRRAWVKNTSLFAMSQHLGMHQDALHRVAKEMELPARRSNNERWADFHSDRMEVLWRQGLSASEIARALTREFGLTYSRNAVIGRANRMGLSGRDKAAPPKFIRPPTVKPVAVKTPAPPRKRVRQPKGVGAFVLPPAYGGNGFALAMANHVLNAAAKATRINEPDKPTGIRLEHLTTRSCRWPIGDVQDADFSFCGCQRQDTRPYCEAHNERAYKASEPRKERPYEPHANRPRRAA